MFRVRSTETGIPYRLAIAGLPMLSVAALAVTIWVMKDLLREQEIVAELMEEELMGVNASSAVLTPG